MYWKKGTSTVTTPTIPGYTIGENYDFSLVLVTETGEELHDAYLFVPQPECAGLMQAKLPSESEYKAVQGPFDANCSLGYIPEATETTIDLRIAFPEGTSDGYRIIPLLVGHDDGAQPPNPHFSDDWSDLWQDDWADQELLSDGW